MEDRLKIDLYRYLWNTEVLYANKLTDVRNDFMKFKIHSLTAYETLYTAELEYKLFMKLSKDIEILLRQG